MLFQTKVYCLCTFAPFLNSPVVFFWNGKSSQSPLSLGLRQFWLHCGPVDGLSHCFAETKHFVYTRLIENLKFPISLIYLPCLWTEGRNQGPWKNLRSTDGQWNENVRRSFDVTWNLFGFFFSFFFLKAARLPTALNVTWQASAGHSSAGFHKQTQNQKDECQHNSVTPCLYVHPLWYTRQVEWSMVRLW